MEPFAFPTCPWTGKVRTTRVRMTIMSGLSSSSRSGTIHSTLRNRVVLYQLYAQVKLATYLPPYLPTQSTSRTERTQISSRLAGALALVTRSWPLFDFSLSVSPLLSMSFLIICMSLSRPNGLVRAGRSQAQSSFVKMQVGNFVVRPGLANGILTSRASANPAVQQSP